VHPDLEQAIEFHDAIMAESGKALVGYETARTLANIVTRSSIPSEPPWVKLDAVF
jgi:hypothetical protein